ncbi:MAG: hypothetical protein QOJ29_335, partial [Thermoleophilaceae bacterium]|nr:hypothetical protein [Thermoleophilaceae bacterium]
PAADRLDVVASNVAAATVDAARARLSCAPLLNVKSDGPLDLRIDCSRPVVKAARCSSSIAFRLPRVSGQRVVSVVISRNGHRLKTSRGRNVRSVTLRRVSRKAFSVRVAMRTSGAGGKVGRVTLVRRIGGC